MFQIAEHSSRLIFFLRIFGSVIKMVKIIQKRVLYLSNKKIRKPQPTYLWLTLWPSCCIYYIMYLKLTKYTKEITSYERKFLSDESV